MKLLEKIKGNIATIKFTKDYNKYLNSGKFKHFDKEFLSQFDGKYYHGLPIYYYLTDYMSNGKCYDVSIVLCLAMGEGTYLCRGELNSQLGLWNKDRLGHGWVETDDMVYDTTWKIMCKKEDYYKVFKPKYKTRKDYKTAEKGLRKITDTNIRSKDWYENNFDPGSCLLIFQVRELEKLKLQGKFSDEEKEFARKVINDLPKVELKEFDKITLMPKFDTTENIF